MNKATIRTLHDRAVKAVDAAALAKRTGDSEGARAAMAEALELERRAAEITPLGVEPDRSWLYEGAATLALECGEFEEAARLAAAGLAGRPSAEVASELKRVRDEAAVRMVSASRSRNSNRRCEEQ
jgi:hypothetical protein